MKEFFDKLITIWTLIKSRNYVLFTVNDLNDISSSDCRVSYGIDNAIKNKDIDAIPFLDTISEFTKTEFVQAIDDEYYQEIEFNFDKFLNDILNNYPSVADGALREGLSLKDYVLKRFKMN